MLLRSAGIYHYDFLLFCTYYLSADHFISVCNLVIVGLGFAHVCARRLIFTHIIDSHRKFGPSPLPAFVIVFNRGVSSRATEHTVFPERALVAKCPSLFILRLRTVGSYCISPN